MDGKQARKPREFQAEKRALMPGGRTAMSSRNNNRTDTTRISGALRDALLGGRPLTYQELASAAGCDERTVRNYVNERSWEPGLSRARSRGSDGRVRVVCDQAAQSVSFETMALDLAHDVLRRFFPIAGTSLDRKRLRVGANVAAASVRGAYEYGEEHLSAVRKWLTAVGEPRRVVCFSYRSLSSEHGPRRVWPVGVLIREMATVYLVGHPAESTEPDAIRMYSLERVEAPVRLLSARESGAVPDGLAALSIADAGDLPFSIFRATGADAVKAKLRFSMKVANRIWGRRWHGRQRMRKLRDGRVELTFGPVEVSEVLDWIGQWEGEVEVIGDAKLIAARQGEDDR